MNIVVLNGFLGKLHERKILSYVCNNRKWVSKVINIQKSCLKVGNRTLFVYECHFRDILSMNDSEHLSNRSYEVRIV